MVPKPQNQQNEMIEEKHQREAEYRNEYLRKPIKSNV